MRYFIIFLIIISYSSLSFAQDNSSPIQKDQTLKQSDLSSCNNNIIIIYKHSNLLK